MKLMKLRKTINSRNGVSLIEILAALAVFVIGILSVVRMFPGGFATVMHSANSTIASRLAQAELERWQNRPSNLPSGILPWGPITNGEVTTLGTIADADPDDLNNPFIEGDPQYSDVNKFRRVFREATVIPPVSKGFWGNGSIYILGFSPIDYDNTSPTSMVIYSGPLRRRFLPYDLNNLVLNDMSRYSIDYDSADGNSDQAVVYVAPASYPRTYVISYNYWVQDSGGMTLKSVVSQILNVDVAAPGDKYTAIPIPDPNQPAGTTKLLKNVEGFKGIDRRSESFSRGFENLNLTGNVFSNTNPYQFRVQNTVPGVIIFNPLGYGMNEVTARGKEPLTAYIDYTVHDWHTINEERKLDDRHKLKLSLGFVKELDKDYGGMTAYQGLEPNLYPQYRYDVLAVDMETGRLFTEKYRDANDQPAFTMDYQAGVLTFNPTIAISKTTDLDITGHTFRVYYQADGNWAVQFYKALDNYSRAGTEVPSEREYAWNSTDSTSIGDKTMTGGKVGFRRCYMGCTVDMDIRYTYTDKDGQNPVTTVARGMAYRIPDNNVTDVGGAKVCYVDVVGQYPTDTGLLSIHPLAKTITINDITSVYGVSVGAKVVWRETGRGFENGRWKQKTLQTYLTRLAK